MRLRAVRGSSRQHASLTQPRSRARCPDSDEATTPAGGSLRRFRVLCDQTLPASADALEGRSSLLAWSSHVARSTLLSLQRRPGPGHAQLIEALEEGFLSLGVDRPKDFR